MASTIGRAVHHRDFMMEAAMSTLQDLESRIKALEDLEAIKRLKARYFRCLDRQLWTR